MLNIKSIEVKDLLEVLGENGKGLYPIENGYVIEVQADLNSRDMSAAVIAPDGFVAGCVSGSITPHGVVHYWANETKEGYKQTYQIGINY